MRAAELKVGDQLNMAIGPCRVEKIKPKRGGLEVIVSGRPTSQGSVLFFWLDQEVYVGKVPNPYARRVRPRGLGPRSDANAKTAHLDDPTPSSALTGTKPEKQP